MVQALFMQKRTFHREWRHNKQDYITNNFSLTAQWEIFFGLSEWLPIDFNAFEISNISTHKNTIYCNAP